MKLYATTTSERASKGQGGNDFLSIVITDELGNVITDIFVKPKEKEGITDILIEHPFITRIRTEIVPHKTKEKSNEKKIKILFHRRMRVWY